MAQFFGFQTYTTIEIVMASALLAAFPPLIVYILNQSYLRTHGWNFPTAEARGASETRQRRFVRTGANICPTTLRGSHVASLRDIARRANVSIRAAFQVLNGTSSATKAVQRHVLAAARDLRYKLNVTLRDVAGEANVSITTVSCVLHDNPEIGPATRARVLEAIEALDYRVNKTARNLKTKRTHMIGYPWHITEDPDRFSPALDRFLYSVALTAESYGYHLLTFIEPQPDVVRIYKELVRSRSVDGFILSEPCPDDPRWV
jgi:DNA-binding LacI/PurR family transcriptional regulator